jgi:hypothetical protein
MKRQIALLDSAVARLKFGGEVIAAALLFSAIEFSFHAVALRIGRRRILSAGF